MSSSNIKTIISFQILTRAITFTMNNMILRSVSPAHLGFISLKLDLLSNTILALSREGIRLTGMRVGSSESESKFKSKSKGLLAAEEQIKRLGKLVLPLTVLIGSLCSLITIKFTSNLSPTLFTEFKRSVFLYFLSSVLEALIEPSVIDLIARDRVKEKVFIESMALVVKVSVLFWKLTTVKVSGIDLEGLLRAFSDCQLIQAITLNVLHLCNDLRSSKLTHLSSILTFKLPKTKYISLATSLTFQEFFKYFLSQGDLFIVNLFSFNPKDQGVYSIVSNYGSLFSRLIFNPIEVASLQYFSKVKDDDQDLKYFCLMLKTFVLVGLVFICYGSLFTDPLVYFLLGRKWFYETEAANCLSVYCYLVAISGISGFLDSFVRSKIDLNWMSWQRKVSIYSSIIHCILSIWMVRWKGSTLGLILSNSLNLFLNSLLSIYFIQKTRKVPWKSALIPPKVFISFAAAFTVNLFLFFMSRKREDWMMRISVAVSLFIVNFSLIVRCDRGFVNEFKDYWMSK